jgi:uncharacterized membrane protein
VKTPQSRAEYEALKRRRWRADFQLRIVAITGGGATLIASLIENKGPLLTVVGLIALVSVLVFLARFIVIATRYFVAKHRQGFKWAAWGDIPKKAN